MGEEIIKERLKQLDETKEEIIKDIKKGEEMDIVEFMIISKLTDAIKEMAKEIRRQIDKEIDEENNKEKEKKGERNE